MPVVFAAIVICMSQLRIWPEHRPMLIIRLIISKRLFYYAYPSVQTNRKMWWNCCDWISLCWCELYTLLILAVSSMQCLIWDASSIKRLFSRRCNAVWPSGPSIRVNVYCFLCVLEIIPATIIICQISGILTPYWKTFSSAEHRYLDVWKIWCWAWALGGSGRWCVCTNFRFWHSVIY